MSSSATRFDGPLFREEQRLNQLWLWRITQLILVITFLVVVGAGVAVVAMELRHPSPFGAREAVLNLAILAAVALVVGLLTFLPFRLIAEVRRDGLYVRFIPFHRSFLRFGWDEIETYEARAYRPILEYGGCGLRYSFRHGKAYNVSGNRGVQLVLKNGKRLLIGSQRADEFTAAIRRARGERIRFS
ncbi:MAG: DUF6141 family protein [Candidatus Sumerlaeota bacterium]|nr:DUF6141 family protein [Candidatus Sumerlaeota bacterium]